MEYILETERLLLRKCTIDDAEFILQLINTPDWLKYIGDRNIKTKEQAIEYLKNGPLKSYEENGFGSWMVEMKNGKIPIGTCGIHKRENLDGPDIGYAFLPAFTGKGFAFEIANATMEFATNTLKLPVILGIVNPWNKKSIKLLEKIGLKFKSSFYFPGKSEEVLLFSNSKD